MQKITPFLWFDSQAEEAANFYVSIFKNSKVGKITRYGRSSPVPCFKCCKTRIPPSQNV